MPEANAIFRQNRWEGGYADSLFLGMANSGWRVAGCEGRRFPRILQLQKRLLNQASTIITTQINDAIVASNGDSIAVGAAVAGDGKIYRRAAGANTWAVVYTHTGSGDLYSVYEFNGYIVWSSADKIHRVAIANIATWATPDLNYKTLSTNNTHPKPMIEAFNKLYIGNGRYVDELDSNVLTWTTGKLTFASDDAMRRITFSGSVMKFYCRKTSDARNEGWVFFWDGLSASWNERTKIDGIFHCVTTMDNVDYFLAGHVPFLYRLDGLTPAKLRAIPQNTASGVTDASTIVANFYANAMANLNGIIYFGSGLAVSGITGVDNTEVGVWSFGRLNINFQESLSFDFPSATAPTADSVIESTCLFVAEGMINIASRSASAKFLYVTNPSAYQSTGEYECRVFDGNNGWQRKDSAKLAIAFFPLATGEKIEIFLRKNLVASYGSAILTVDYSNTADRDVTFKELILPWVGKEFNHTQFKIKLTAGTSNATTPKFLDIALFYHDIKVK